MTQSVDKFTSNEAIAEQGGLQIVRLMAVLGVCAGAILLVAGLLREGEVPQGNAPWFMALNLGVLALVWRGRLRNATIVQLWGTTLLVLESSSRVSGLYGATVQLLPLLTILCGWLLGARQAALLAAMQVVGVGGVYWLHATGYAFAPLRPAYTYAIVSACMIAVSAAAGVVTALRVRRQYEALAQLAETLELRVTERTAELSKALEHLKQSQGDLIQSEKLASLGSMVAGVSHELNTPIGNAVTVASTLIEQAKTLDAAFQAGTLKRSEMASSLGGITAMAELIDRSVNRAATLIASFKQVAVDQTSERRREFDLQEMVEDVICSLRPGLRSKPWQLINAIPQGILCDSFPGPLGQIVTNLIQNAVLHAFAGQVSGTITLTATTKNAQLSLSVIDDGVGMDSVTLVHIYDPFFTTKLGQGGSGLGLSICHRIATNILAGTLKTTSSPGSGSTFTLEMPLRTPGKL